MGCGAIVAQPQPSFYDQPTPSSARASNSPHVSLGPFPTIAETGPVNISSFEYISILGEGGFGQVKSAIKKKSADKILYAIKEVNIGKILTTGKKHNISLLLNELNILKEIETCFIIKLHYAFRSYAEMKVFFVFDCFLGGDLRLHLKNGHVFSEMTVAYYLACIGSALYYLHLKNIIHRDVKPENIMLDHHGVPYLTDFGISFKSPTENQVVLCNLSSGTMAYLAPEVLTPSHRHSYQSDFWSLGVVGYELLFGRRPFQKHCPREFVYFVENNYRYVWDRLESEECQMFDWSDEPLLSHENVDVPYPNHLIPLLPNGDLPETLRVRYPPILLCGNPTTEECKDLVDSLLDVRIHQRCGIISQHSKFSNHRWFQRELLLENSKKMLKGVTPPFQPDLETVEKLIASKFSAQQSPLDEPLFEVSPLSSNQQQMLSPRNQANSPPPASPVTPSHQIFQHIIPSVLNSSSSDAGMCQIPEDVRLQLQEFHFISPEYQNGAQHNSATARTACSPRLSYR
jgi:serine/threonine protein kinase